MPRICTYHDLQNCSRVPTIPSIEIVMTNRLRGTRNARDWHEITSSNNTRKPGAHLAGGGGLERRENKKNRERSSLARKIRVSRVDHSSVVIRREWWACIFATAGSWKRSGRFLVTPPPASGEIWGPRSLGLIPCLQRSKEATNDPVVRSGGGGIRRRRDSPLQKASPSIERERERERDCSLRGARFSAGPRCHVKIRRSLRVAHLNNGP